MAPGRSSIGASARPRYLRMVRCTPGAFQGSDMLGVTMPLLAKLVSNPTASRRSSTRTR